MESGAINSSTKGGGGGGGGGEVRRVNIVYFLSRDGRIEHPHLIRVHHHHRRNGGIHLRDVKRWLSELRGKDMPESFAWSYKRRYKNGYVWQDLMDDELITPISDNEYVLKGSLIQPGKLPPAPPPPPDAELAFPTSPGAVDVQKAAEELKPTPPETLEIDQLDGGDLVSPKPPPRLDQESPPSAQPAEPLAAGRQSAVFKIDLAERRREEAEEEVREEKKEIAAAAAAAEDGRVSGGSGRRSYSKRRASHVLRSILTCGRVETNDSALLPVGRRRGEDGGPHSRTSMAVRPRHHKRDPTKNDSRKNRATGSGGTSSRRAGERPVSAAYKPIAAPNCSQCGKGFNPEKLHSHMKSCRALKGRGSKNGSANLERMPLATDSRSEDFSKDSASGLLT